MARSDRMAALKAARKAKMEARRARMADKKAKKTRPKTAADKAFKDTFKKSGGMAAMAARKKARRAAVAKPKTKTETTATVTKGTNNTPAVIPRDTSKRKLITPRDTPERKIAANELDAKIADADRMVDKDQNINASINKFGERIKNTVTNYMDRTKKEFPEYKKRQDEKIKAAREKALSNMKRQNNTISSFMKSLVTKDDVKVKDDVKRIPSNTGRYGAGINNKPRDLGADKMKKGGSVKKKMKKGGSVKKNMGGKVRGYGMARGGKVVKSS